MPDYCVNKKAPSPLGADLCMVTLELVTFLVYYFFLLVTRLIPVTLLITPASFF
jgi:hypothetical protein